MKRVTRAVSIKAGLLSFSTIFLLLNSANSQQSHSSTNAVTPNMGPFSTLADVVQLPALPGGTAPASGAAVDLGQIDPTILSNSQIELIGDCVDLEDLYQFTLKHKMQQNLDSWDVMINRKPDIKTGSAPIIGSGRSMSEPIAHLCTRSGRLLFEWNPDNITRYSSQLSNTFLEFSAGSTTHTIQLRKLVTRDSILLDLEKDVIRVPIDVENLPQKDLLSIKINDIEFQGYGTHGPGFLARPITGTAKIGDSVRLARTDGIDTNFKVSLVDRSSGPELNIRATFSCAGEHNKPFVAKTVISSRESQQSALKENEARMAVATAAISGIESRLNAAMALQPNDAGEQIAKQNRIGQAKAELRRAQSTIRRYERSIPKLKASLDSMKQVGDIGKVLHKNIRFHVSVVATSGTHTLELIRFGDLKVAQGSALMASP